MAKKDRGKNKLIEAAKHFSLKAVSILFPKFCFNCQKEGSYLCPDCQSLLEMSGFHQKGTFANLSDLYFVFDYKNPLVKNLIRSFKYEPLIKELGRTFSSLIVAHFQLMDKKPEFYPLSSSAEKTSGFVMVPVPLHKKKLKWRGFNQAEVLAQGLADFFKVPLAADCLAKTKETSPQTELDQKTRKENVKNSFSIKEKSLIKDKKILLVDDVYTTGATLQECARVLKENGAKKVFGIVVARG